MFDIEVLGKDLFPDEEFKTVSFEGTHETTPAIVNVNGVTFTIPPNKHVALPISFVEALINSGVDALVEDYPPQPSGPENSVTVDLASALAEAEKIKTDAEAEAARLRATTEQDALKVLDEAEAAAKLKASNAQAEADAILKAARDEAAAIVAAASTPPAGAAATATKK